MQYSSGTSVENIIYGSYVKMERLNKIVYDAFSNSSVSSATELNIYVDLYSVMKSIFSESYRTNIDDYTSITSCIINLCSHYRKFFRGLQVKTNFFLIFSYNTCEINRKFIGDYNEIFKKKSELKVFRDIATNNFKLLSMLCPYLPDIHFVVSTRNYESSVIMASLIERSIGSGIPNIILSKDLYPIQLTTLYPNTAFLYPIKFRGTDSSVLIPINEKYNYKEEFWSLISFVRKINVHYLESIPTINFPLLSAMNRFPERNLGTLADVRIASKFINKITNGAEVEVYIQNLYSDNEINTTIPVNMVEARLKTLDVRYILPMYKEDPEYMSIRLENLVDNETINKINSKFFYNNPIDINNL